MNELSPCVGLSMEYPTYPIPDEVNNLPNGEINPLANEMIRLILSHCSPCPLVGLCRVSVQFKFFCENLLQEQNFVPEQAKAFAAQRLQTRKHEDKESIWHADICSDNIDRIKSNWRLFKPYLDVNSCKTHDTQVFLSLDHSADRVLE